MHIADAIIEHTVEVFQRTPVELRVRSRKRPVVEARQAAMWVIRQRYPSLSLETIGAALGGRHYTTVMHALAVVEDRARSDGSYRARLQQIMIEVSPPATSMGAQVTTQYALLASRP